VGALPYPSKMAEKILKIEKSSKNEELAEEG
jgi:hypothetical protein